MSVKLKPNSILFASINEKIGYHPKERAEVTFKKPQKKEYLDNVSFVDNDNIARMKKTAAKNVAKSSVEREIMESVNEVVEDQDMASTNKEPKPQQNE
ncbi:22513_t:CDS:2, partial [Racocetra persica]